MNARRRAGGVVMDKRLSALEEYVEEQVRQRLERELEAVFDRLEQALPREELRRVLEIIAHEKDRGYGT